MNTGSQLRQKRIEAGISLTRLAPHFRVGVAWQRLQQIENAARVTPEAEAAYLKALESFAKQKRQRRREAVRNASEILRSLAEVSES